ncbi:hypothetical protein V0M98_39255 (plasmid) [Pseudomonas silesiensis]|uniref:hypothetical protein n=1 Tax=Pseudomonas silesiensis TaxID=1853130 RepID=UPI0030D525D0
METELTATQREALVRFKSKQGRHWKSCLVALWVMAGMIAPRMALYCARCAIR